MGAEGEPKPEPDTTAIYAVEALGKILAPHQYVVPVVRELPPLTFPHLEDIW